MKHVWIWKSADGPICFSGQAKARKYVEELFSGGRWILGEGIAEYWLPSDLQNQEPTALLIRERVL